ncbi:hypothetical protein E2542_SST15173 [Spatholobus suberectus]|nr:hypothetical protein E2542_SST15173 [Spatholobus suberectus]
MIKMLLGQPISANGLRLCPNRPTIIELLTQFIINRPFTGLSDSTPGLAVPSPFHYLPASESPTQTRHYHAFLFHSQEILTLPRPTLLNPTVPDPPLFNLFLRVVAPEHRKSGSDRVRSKVRFDRPGRRESRASSVPLLLFFAQFRI